MLDDSFTYPGKAKGYSEFGLDTESVVVDTARNALWVSDEYGPSLLEINRAGQLVRRYTLPVRQVRELIAELLVDNGATLEQVAARLHMPARRLRERLAVAGVRFNDLITDYRCRLAKDLLLNSDERIDVIVERTGFSEPSTFYRAFKRWVGETPVEFRRRGRCSSTV